MANRPGPAVLQVHIFRDGEFLGTDIFAERQIVVGRDPDEADLVLESSQVSRRHAIIENDNGKVHVRDAGSTNGVFVNADKIEGTVEVTRLDEIHIGEFALKIKFASKTKGDREVPTGATARPDDATGSMAAMRPDSTASTASAKQPAREDPTRVIEAHVPVSSKADRTAKSDTVYESLRASPAPARAEPAPVTRARAQASHDLSEFDDVLDDQTEAEVAIRSPRAEFRRRDEPVDRDKLGDMLAGIGIGDTSDGVHASTVIDAEPLPMAKSESGRRGGKGKGAGFADLATELEGAEIEAPTRTNITTGFDASDYTDEPSMRPGNDRPTNGKPAAQANGKETLVDGLAARAGGDRSPFFGGSSGAASIPHDDPEAESLSSGAPVQARGMPKPPDVFGLQGDPMSAFEPHADLTHDDDDDDHDDFVPTYSLAQHILAEELPPKNGVPRVEVLAIRDDVVEGVTLLAPGESFWVGPTPSIARLMTKASSKEGGVPYKAGPRFELVKHKKPGEVEIEFKKDARGLLTRGGRSLELGAVQAKQGRKQVRRGTQLMGLARGELAQVDESGVMYHVRQIIAPAPLRDSRSFLTRIKPERLLMGSSLGALGFHFFAMLLFSLIAGPPPEAKEHAQEEFIEVTVEPEMKLEEPPPPPPEPTPPAPEPAPAPQPKPVPQKVPKNVKLPKVAATQAPPNPAPVGVLGLLNKTGATQAPGQAAAVAAISNLAAAKTPSGSSGYKVSGLIGKLPTSDLSIGGGGGGPMTKGAAALLRGGGGGAGVLSGKTTGKVGGLVTKLPQQMHAAGGSLDRDEIQKVVNKHVGEIQRCYERELLKTPNLAGKVTVEWVVSTSGSVKSSRQKDSTLQSSAAVNCMLSSIKGWQFPTPKGGDVVVSYPFSFSAIGM